MYKRIKYPIGINKHTKMLMDASDVKNGINCECICWNCKEDLVAINNDKNKITDHFRHKSDSTCDANYESYIHWLTKEIFKNLEYIHLPEIKISDLQKTCNDLNYELENLYKNYRIEFKSPPNYTVQSEMKFGIKEVKIEQTISNMRADILIYENPEQILIVEPFYSNPIDENKLNKIIKLDKTVISISLKEFSLNHNHIFTIEQFKSFLITNTEYKKWIYIRNSKARKLIKDIILKIENKLKQQSTNLEKRKYLIEKKKSVYKQIDDQKILINDFKLNLEKLYESLSDIEDKIETIEDKISQNL